jgi:anti-sigma factor RsiW
VSCESARSTVHGYFDGELDAVRAAEFERHLESCAECQASLEQMKSLRARLRQPDLYKRASPRLGEQVRRQLAPVAPVKLVPVKSGRRFWTPVFVTLVVATGFSIAWFLRQAHTETAQLTAELIDAHVRSLQLGHLTDVQSTDQHTVKPWFDGKLDFIPPVADYSAQGFPLLGGRLDVVDGHSVAALVYGRRKHIINLFIWPDSGPGAKVSGEHSQSRQGYNLVMWRAGEMQFCLLSDVSAGDLAELKRLIH